MQIAVDLDSGLQIYAAPAAMHKYVRTLSHIAEE